MADLDDFFAKKDKKKSKTKKFLTAEELAKQLEDTSKRSAEPPKPKKERPASSAGGGEGEDSSNPDQRQDDEWKEFEEEERKDYSGLKLTQLTISEDNQNNSGQDGDGGHDSSDGEGNTTHSERRHAGPWKKVVDDSSQQIQEPEPPQPQPMVQKSSKYVSPAFRGQMNQAGRPVKLRNKDAPDITNEEYFPTLGAARPEEQRKKKNEPAFEEVRHGSRVTRIQEVQQSAPVSVGNRFRSLADDDS